MNSQNQKTSEQPNVLPNSAIRVENLSWGPDADCNIVRNISFELARGKILGIVGANGAGKSSLLRCLYRIHKPTAGSVKIFNEDVWQCSASQFAQKVAVVLQHSHIEFNLTVRQIIEMGRTPYYRLFSSSAGDHKIIDEIVEQLELQLFIDRPFNKLSGGEKQRVYLARALVQQPDILILDEPTNHLDIRHQLEIMQLISTLNLTVVVSLHDLNLAACYSDYILLLSRGEMLFYGEPETTLTPEHIQQAFNVDCHISQHQKLGRQQFMYSLMS